MSTKHRIIFVILSLIFLIASFKETPCLKQAKAQSFPLFPFTLRVKAEDYIKSSPMLTLDKNGILMVDYKKVYAGYGPVIFHNPLFISHYALALYQDFMESKNEVFKEKFFKQLDFLFKNKKIRRYKARDFWVWEYPFENKKFGAKAPWVSALANGTVLTAFLMGYNLTREPKYLSAAEMAFRAFLVSTQFGGVSTFENGVAWYEEVAHESAPSSKILNGHISALQGLWVLGQGRGRKDVENHLKLGIKAVKRDLKFYDAGFISYYSPYPTDCFAPAHSYNTFHVHQLLWLYDISSEPDFLYYALRFARYDDPGWLITTAGSTDPKGHGPKNLALEWGNKYWSHNQFPTWVQIDLGTINKIGAITIIGYIPKSTPKDYDILSSLDGKEWNLLIQRRGNTDQYPKEDFGFLKTRYIRLVILNDNGNNNVALAGLGIHCIPGNPTAVSDWQSYDLGNRPAWIFTSGWKVPAQGWLVADLARPKSKIVMEFKGAKSPNLSFLGSNYLKTFRTLVFTKSKVIGRVLYTINTDNYRYLKIDLSKATKGAILKVISTE